MEPIINVVLIILILTQTMEKSTELKRSRILKHRTVVGFAHFGGKHNEQT